MFIEEFDNDGGREDGNEGGRGGKGGGGGGQQVTTEQIRGLISSFQMPAISVTRYRLWTCLSFWLVTLFLYTQLTVQQTSHGLSK